MFTQGFRNRGSVVAGAAGVAVAFALATSTCAQQTEARSLEVARSARGLDRFFPIDEPLVHSVVRGSPMCLKAFRPGEPDPEPFRGMMLEPMFDEDGRPRLVACFSPLDPPPQETIDLFNLAMGMNDRFQPGTRWTGTAGNPITLTYSFVPDTVNIGSGVGEPAANSSLFAVMDSQFASVGGRTAWISLFQQCFDRWAYLTGTSYTRVTAAGVDWDDGASWGSGSGATRGQIRIGMHPIDGALGVLAYNSFPQNGDMVLDAGENWAQSSSTNYRFFRNTVMHEHGHGLGFNHVCPTNGTKLMEPFLNTNFDGPRADELRAASNHYGDAFGTITTTATAFDIGSIVASTTYTPTNVTGGTITNGSLGSIDKSTEVDVFKFTSSAPLIATISLTPVGGNYADYVQDSSCNNTTANTNANAMADLVLEVLDSAGSVVATQNATTTGSGESLSGFLLSPGVGYLRVSHNAASTYNGVQLYSLSMTTSSSPLVNAWDGLDSAAINVAWTVIPNATSYTVYRATTNSRASASLVATIPGSPASFFDENVYGGITYYYWVEVSQSSGPSKPINSAGESGFVTSPTNDNCLSAAQIVGAGVMSVPVETYGATTDGPQTCPSSIFLDAWYKWTPPSSGTLNISLCSAIYDSAIAVYTGISCPPGPPLGCNNDSASCGGNPTASNLTVNVAGAVPYLIRVGGASATQQGGATMTLTFTADAQGSCCLADGSCMVTTESGCSTANWSSGGDCDPNPCSQPTGACCAGASCSIASSGACTGSGGSYLGNASTCQGWPSNPITCCQANYDHVSNVNSDDLFAFLDDWFAQSGSVGPGHSTDVNHDNSVNSDDMFAFLDLWFTGCN